MDKVKQNIANKTESETTIYNQNKKRNRFFSPIVSKDGNFIR